MLQITNFIMFTPPLDVDWVAVVVALILIFFVYTTIGLVETQVCELMFYS